MGPSSQQGVNFTHEDTEFILNIAGCHPYLLQAASFHTFESRSKQAGVLDYNEIERQVTADTMPFVQRVFYGLPETAKDAVFGMARGRRSAQSVLNELRGNGIVGEDGKLFCSLFKQFASTLVTEREQGRASESMLEEVDDLLKRLEQEMRDFLKHHWETKYGTKWPNNLRKRNSDEFRKWLQRMPKEAQKDSREWQDILRYTDFPDPFQIIRYEWGDLKGVFPFSRDANKSRRRLEERKEFLTMVRNAIKHSREGDLTAFELDKARLFCRELLAMLTEAFD